MAKKQCEYPPLQCRPWKTTFCLFDMDGTLCLEKKHASPDMHALLSRLRQKCTIGYVSGGCLSKQQRQLGSPSIPVSSLFDFCFPENGLSAIRLGVPLTSQEHSFVHTIGGKNYNQFISWVLRYISDLDIPVKRGTFVELRFNNVNISPIGQGASFTEMEDFRLYNQSHRVLKTMIEALEDKFAHLNLKCAMGGKTCFDVFLEGWDKTYCLRHVEAERERSGLVYDEVHFFADKIGKRENDYELYRDERTIGHKVSGPEDTMKQVKELFDP
ncbi:phosphomannomutase [Xylariaceae sp. FL0255]|nr:phosphomannomutase [Xylariaceae sp. FL0255]